MPEALVQMEMRRGSGRSGADVALVRRVCGGLRGLGARGMPTIRAEPLAEGVEGLVVGAAIADADGRLLLLKRREGPFLGGKFEFPAGVVEAGESLGDALRREVLEETGLEIERIGGRICSFDFVSRRGRALRRFDFAVVVKETQGVRLSEHDAYVWAGTGGMHLPCMTENTLKALTAYLALCETIGSPEP